MPLQNAWNEYHASRLAATSHVELPSDVAGERSPASTSPEVTAVALPHSSFATPPPAVAAGVHTARAAAPAAVTASPVVLCAQVFTLFPPKCS